MMGMVMEKDTGTVRGTTKTESTLLGRTEVQPLRGAEGVFSVPTVSQPAATRGSRDGRIALPAGSS